VRRLRQYLDCQQPEQWTTARLTVLRDAVDESERQEELEIVQQWFPPFRDVYRRAGERGQLIVCEEI
jgi:hypothetical protein